MSKILTMEEILQARDSNKEEYDLPKNLIEDIAKKLNICDLIRVCYRNFGMSPQKVTKSVPAFLKLAIR